MKIRSPCRQAHLWVFAWMPYLLHWTFLRWIICKCFRVGTARACIFWSVFSTLFSRLTFFLKICRLSWTNIWILNLWEFMCIIQFIVDLSRTSISKKWSFKYLDNLGDRTWKVTLTNFSNSIFQSCKYFIFNFGWNVLERIWDGIHRLLLSHNVYF